MNRFQVLLAGLIIFPACACCQAPRFPTEKLDSFISKAMRDWHLIGPAIAVIKKTLYYWQKDMVTVIIGTTTGK